MTYRDGEVIGIAPNGTLLQWNADEKAAYNCGETLEQFGIHNLTGTEAQRLYDALPVTATPSEFLCGHGNWGLTEAESKLATHLANIIELES